MIRPISWEYDQAQARLKLIHSIWLFSDFNKNIFSLFNVVDLNAGSTYLNIENLFFES